MIFIMNLDMTYCKLSKAKPIFVDPTHEQLYYHEDLKLGYHWENNHTPVASHPFFRRDGKSFAAIFIRQRN
jgi:hypothetical protein